jgi:hypothetical protein
MPFTPMNNSPSIGVSKPLLTNDKASIQASLWAVDGELRYSLSVYGSHFRRASLELPRHVYTGWSTTFGREKITASEKLAEAWPREIFNMLRRARLYYSSGDERAALFTLHNALASTLSLLCEAEGVQWRDIGMRGMVWELKRRHWIDLSEASLFKKLQHLRNVAAHEHDRIDERIASHADMVLLFGFFEDYVQRTFKRLTNLLAMKGSGGGLDKVD